MSKLIIADVSAIMRTNYVSLDDRSGYRRVLSYEVDGEVVNTSAMYGLYRSTIGRFGLTDDVDYVFAFDTPNNLLKQVDKNYKGNRVKWNDDYFSQVNTVYKNLQEVGFSALAEAGYEADHIIHKVVADNKDFYDEVLVVTNDKDLSSLVSENVRWVATIQKRGEITMENYEEELACPYNSILLKKCLVGDKSDNIKGIYRFGQKAFDKFMEENVEKGFNVRGHEVEVINNSNLDEDKKAQALLASELVLPLEVSVNSTPASSDLINKSLFKEILNKFGMKSISNKIKTNI